MLNQNLMCNGYQVVVSPSYPKMQLSADCPVTDDFRKEMNKWMLEFFGVSNVVDDDSALVDELNKVIYINQNQFNALKASFDSSSKPVKMGL